MSYCLCCNNTDYDQPDAVEDVAIGEDSDIQVWLDDVVKLCLLLISEECVRHPDLARQVNTLTERTRW